MIRPVVPGAADPLYYRRPVPEHSPAAQTANAKEGARNPETPPRKASLTPTDHAASTPAVAAGIARNPGTPPRKASLAPADHAASTPAVAAGATAIATGQIEPRPRRGGSSRPRTAKQGANCGKPVSAEAQRTVTEFVESVFAIGVEGYRKEFLEIKKLPQPTPTAAVAFTANPDRNRYKDVLCIDATRVALSLNVPPLPDYIHANWVRMENNEKTYIATQAPLENTVCDFWRLCFQEKVTTILALCNVIENGKVKMSQYWPLEPGSTVTHGCMQVINKQVSEEDRVVTYVLEVLPEGFSNSVVVRLLHMSEWPDRGVPEYGFCVLRILRKVDKAAPCIIHCSAGIGRTGTAIAIDTIVQRLFKCIPADVKSVVQELRSKRASSVQTEAQYLFIVTTVLSYVKVKMPALQEKTDAFRTEVKKAGLI